MTITTEHPVTGAGIGIIGVGGVARYAHLPSYRASGLPVTALYDIHTAVAGQVAHEFRVPTVSASAEELIRRDDVDLIDLATPPASHQELLRMVAASGKPCLVQKPLCTSREELEQISALRATGARFRLNLTGRYVSAWQTVRDLLTSGAIGDPYLCTIRNRDWWDREPGRWDHTIEEYIIFEMMIHHLDLCDFFFGLPSRATARTGTHPGQLMQQANWATATLEYASGLVVQLVEDWTMHEFSFSSGHPFEELMIMGSSGVIRASSERVELSRLGGGAIETWHLPRPGQMLPGNRLDRGWFPDSFGAAMHDYRQSLMRGDDPDEDWLHLIRLTEQTLTLAEATRVPRWLVL